MYVEALSIRKLMYCTLQSVWKGIMHTVAKECPLAYPPTTCMPYLPQTYVHISSQCGGEKWKKGRTELHRHHSQQPEHSCHGRHPALPIRSHQSVNRPTYHCITIAATAIQPICNPYVILSALST